MKKTVILFSALTLLFILSALLYNTMADQSAPEDELVYFETPSPTATFSVPENSPTPSAVPSVTALPLPTMTAVPTPTVPETARPLSTPEPVLPLPEPTVSSKLPPETTDFTVFTAAGKQISLSSLAGKPIVMNFWASWCTPCQEEMEYFQQVYELYGNDIHFFMISIDTSQKDAETFIQQNGYTFNIYFDTTHEAQQAYSISSIPQTYFIDRKGNITAYKAGTISKNALINGISRIK